MSRICMLTGAKPGCGNHVSRSHRTTRRRFNPSSQPQRFWLPSERRWVRLTLSTRAIKTVNRNGIESVVAAIRARGIKV